MVARRTRYVPERGDVVWVTLDPVAGHEEAKRRPALVLSPKLYNGKAGLALVVPVTSKAKGYPFEAVVQGKKFSGVILVDQVRSIDWKARRVQCIDRAPARVIHEVQQLLITLLSDE